MALTINIDGITGIDESLGDQQQDIVGTPAVFPTDVESVFNTALAAYSATVTGYSVAVGDAIEIAGDPTDGTGGNDVQITADPPITGLSLTDDSGFLFDGTFDSGLDSLAGNNINLLSAANDNVVLGIDAITQEVIFAIYLEEVTDPVSGNIIGGDFWIALFEPIKHPNGSNPDDVVDLANKVFVSAEQVIDFSFEGAPSGQNEFMAFSSGNVTIVASGQMNGDSVNSGQGANLGDGSDKTALGTNSQDIGAGEILNFNFTTGFDTEYIVPGLTPTEASDQNNILFTDVFQTTGAAFNVVKVTGGGPTTNPLVHLSAWNTEGAGPGLETGTDFISGHSDDVQVNITAVFVNGVDVTGDPSMVTDNGDGTFTVIGAVENDRISIVAPSFNRIAIKNDGDDQVAFSIQAFSLESTSSERAEAGSKLDFYDDGPSQGAQDVNLTVYEDALTGGNLDGTGDVLVATDNLSGIFQSGQDAPGLGFGADSTKDGTTLNSDDGQTFDVEVNKGVNVDVGGTTYNDEVILSISNTDHLRILVNTDGDIRLELLAAVEHGAVTTGNPDDDILGIGLGELFEAFDEDGDKQNFSANDVRGLIEDDAPLFDIELGTGGLQTDDADLAGGPDTDTKGVDELFTVETNSPGADGNGGLVYSLALSAASVTTTLKDTATGNTVYLFDELGDIVGREGTDASNAATGDVVFSVSVNSSTGAVTLTQERAVEHSSADTEAPYNGDTVGLGLGAGDYINLVGTLSDTETPPDQATDAVNIAPSISFTDDGPAFEMELGTAVLQTDDADLTGGPDTDTEGVGDLFNVTTNDPGEDGLGALVYSLELGSNAGSVTLKDTATGDTVVLSNNAGVIEGKTSGGQVVFSVSVVSSTGAVTLTQNRAVEHSSADTSGYASDVTGLGAALTDAIRLVGTLSDAETAADTATDYVDLTQKISFTDDGPAFEMELGTAVLQTDDADLTGGPDTDTEGVGDLFNVTTNDPGEDGLGALVYSLELGSNAGSVTLKDTATGDTVVLSNNAGVIEGKTSGGQVVFSVSVVSSTGAVTLTQNRAVEHSSADTSGYASDVTGLGAALTDAIRLVGTLSDAETAADTATDYVDLTQKISFTDDGPAFEMELGTAVLQTDDADLTGGPDTDTEGVGDLFNVTTNDPGEDGLGALVYSLELGSNAGSVTLKDTATGDTVVLSNNAGVIEGKTSGGQVVFSVSVVSSTGAVTLTQNRAVEHSSADTSGYASDVTGLGAALTDAIRLVGTLSDAETAADTATDYVDLTQKISFTDDGPAFEMELGTAVLQTDDADLTGGPDTDTEGVGDLFNVTTNDPGEDGLGALVYSLELGSNAGSVTLKDTATGDTVVLSNNAGVIEGKTSGGQVVFSVSVVSSTGAVTLTQNRAVEHSSADTSGYASDVTGLGAALTDAIRLVGTLSDAETAADTATDYVDLTQKISFTDDGPAFEMELGTAVLQTDDADLTGGPDTDTEGVGDLFNVTTNDPGEDGLGALVYSLELGSNAGSVTLKDTATGDTVVLSNNAGVIEGKTSGGQVVFSVSVVSSTGAVTLTQNRAVEHSSADTSGYASDVTGLGAALTDAIRLVGTLSDAETAADTATDYVDLTQKISFTDDGPAFEMELGTAVLQTDDADLTGGPDTDTEGVGDLFNVTTNDPGEDGLGALVYSLELGSNAGSVTLKDTATGDTVVLSNNAGVIEGKTSGGQVVFSVSVVSSTGAVTLTQNRAVEHSSADTSGYASDVTGLGAALTDAIRLVGTLSDAETAADTATDYVDLTQKISFTDDGPAFEMELGTAVLQTDDADLTGGPDTDTEGVGDLFNVTTNDPGEDGLGALVYSLELGSNAGSVTLKDTATGDTVVLSNNAGVIEGKTSGGQVVFSVSVVSSTGAVTLTQNRAVEHSSADTSGYASDVTGLGAALTDAIRLVGTLSDAETAADTATDYVDLTQKISFTDDGPAFEMELGTAVLQTDDADLTGGPDTDTEGVGDLFNVTTNDPGEDGLGALVYSLELGSNAGSVTLKDTATGDTVVLSNNAGVIEGKTSGGQVVFSVSVVSSTGAVTLTQNRAVEHSSADTSGYASDVTGLGAALTDAIRLVGTLSDAETAADTATDYVDLTQKISFTDDGPAFEMELGTAVLQTDDADLTGGPDTDTEGVGDLFNVTTNDPGEDGLGALVYSLELGSNAGSVTLKDTATGDTVVLSNNAGVIEGKTSGGQVVFSVSVVSSTGAVTLTQNRAVEHSSADTSGYASDVTGLGAALTDAIRLVGTLSDAETAADTATDYVDLTQKISFTDDGPQITVNDASGSYEAGAQGTWSDSPGADAFDSLDIELVSYEIDDNGTVVVNADLTQDLVNPNLFSGSITDDFNGDGVDETVDFTIEFDSPTTYDLQVSTPPGSVVELSTADGSLDAGGPDPVRTLTIDSSEIVFAAVEPTSTPGDIAPFLNTLEANWEGGATFLSAEQMNVSTSGIGNGNNNLNGNANEGIDGDTTSGGKVDESFVVDPTGFNVSAVTVFIDNSVGGYDNPPEDLWYTIYYSDGTSPSGPIEVMDGDLSPEAGGQESFVIGDPTGPNNIDAIQLFMGQGTIKIPVIEFTTSQEFNPESLEMTLNATEADGDSDTDTDGFTIDLDPVVA